MTTRGGRGHDDFGLQKRTRGGKVRGLGFPQGSKWLILRSFFHFGATSMFSTFVYNFEKRGNYIDRYRPASPHTVSVDTVRLGWSPTAASRFFLNPLNGYTPSTL